MGNRDCGVTTSAGYPVVMKPSATEEQASVDVSIDIKEI